jgi:cytochrome b
LIWDLPVRLFHWTLAAGFAVAFGIALLTGEHSSVFPYHMMIGLVLGLMVVLRIIWGLMGTRWARFSTFLHSPAAVVGYMSGIVTGRARRFVGHNPGSAYVILAMFLLVLLLVGTGLMMSSGNESVEEVHGLLAWLLVVLVVVHIAGVVIHTIRHRENITASMIHGHKAAEPTDAIPHAAVVPAIAFTALVVGFATLLLVRFDPAESSVRLPIVGTLQLGEGDEHRTPGEIDPIQQGGSVLHSWNESNCLS